MENSSFHCHITIKLECETNETHGLDSIDWKRKFGMSGFVYKQFEVGIYIYINIEIQKIMITYAGNEQVKA